MTQTQVDIAIRNYFQSNEGKQALREAMHSQEVLTAEDVEERYRITRRQLKTLREKGLPCQKVGREYIYYGDSIRAIVFGVSTINYKRRK